MKRACVLPVLAILLTAVAGAQARGATPCVRGSLGFATIAGPQTYNDVIEETTGPDICAANVVTNDNESIVVGIHVHNRTGFQADDTYSAYLDTDRVPATGSNGAEYVLSVTGGRATLQRFNGTAFEPTAARVATFWADGYGPVMLVGRSDLPAESFDFHLDAQNASGVDRAPDEGVWSYQVRPLRLTPRALKLTPARAGKVFTATLGVIRSDWNIELDEGAVRCAAKLGRGTLRGRGTFRSGRPVCSWRVPHSGAGRMIAGSIGVTFQGVQAGRSFRVRVRR